MKEMIDGVWGIKGMMEKRVVGEVGGVEIGGGVGFGEKKGGGLFVLGGWWGGG